VQEIREEDLGDFDDEDSFNEVDEQQLQKFKQLRSKGFSESEYYGTKFENADQEVMGH